MGPSDPEVWDVEDRRRRLVVKTEPLAQFKVARELRHRIKQAFDAEGIEIPFPQRTVWHRNGDDPALAPTGAQAGR